MERAKAALTLTKDELVQKLKTVILKNKTLESERRVREENKRLDRYDALQVEAVNATRKNAAIDMKWAELFKLDIAQDLSEQLAIQREACDHILASKKRRASNFLEELKKKHAEYIQSLKTCQADANVISTISDENLRTLDSALEQQRASVEAAFLAERSELIKAHKARIEELLDKRRAMEESDLLEQRVKRDEGFRAKLEELCLSDADEFNRAKVVLETSVQELEQHLEKMMATYQLNKEKLDYNLQVLIERNKEHSAIQASYKSRLNKLRETRNTMASKYAKYEAKMKHDNSTLSSEFQRLTKQYTDMQAKAKHFEQVDSARFLEIWAMHEHDIKQMITKLLDSDKAIHELVLGLPWAAPKEEQLQQELDAGNSESGTIAGKSTAILSSDSRDAQSRFRPEKIKMVLDLVYQEASFLLDPKITGERASVDTLLKYLGIESQEDVDLLVSAFFRGQDEDDETLLVEGDDVLRVLAEFVTEKENLRIADVAPDRKKKKKTHAGGEAEEAEYRARRRKEERKFWERLAHVLPEARPKRIYPALLERVEKHYQNLLKREDKIKTCLKLQRENDELKVLLDEYLSAKVNEQLLIPPAQLIRVQKSK